MNWLTLFNIKLRPMNPEIKQIAFTIANYNEYVKFGKTHEVKTGLGIPVRIICTDKLSTNFPIVGLYTEAGQEFGLSFTEKGKYTVREHFTDRDLVITPIPPLSLGWMAVYQSGEEHRSSRLFTTRQQLDTWCSVLDGKLVIKAKVEVLAGAGI